MGLQVTNLTSVHENSNSIPALAEWVKDGRCQELQCRSQMRLGSHVAVAAAQASSCSFKLTTSLGTSYVTDADLRKQTNKQKKKSKHKDTNTENGGQKAVKHMEKKQQNDVSPSFLINNYFKCKWLQLQSKDKHW